MSAARERTPVAGRPPRRARKAAIVVVQAAIVWLLLELALRWLGPAHDGLRGLLHSSTLPTDFSEISSLRELMVRSTLGFRPFEEVEGFVLNSRSLRTREYTERKPPGWFRLIALGDSFTYGGVPDAAHWTGRIEAGLAAARGAPVEALRFGVPATGPPFQLRLWQIEGSRLAPDAVVQAFFVGNDFFDEQPAMPGESRLGERLAGVSYVFRVGRNLLRLRRDVDPAGSLGATRRSPPRPDRAGSEVPEFDHREHVPTFTEEAYLRVEAERASLCLRHDGLRFAVRLDRVVRLIERLAFEVRRSGATFTVMLIPDEYQVDAELLARVAESVGRSTADYDVDLPQRRLSEALVERGIDVVDLLPAFRASRAGGQALYRPRDTHWSRAGHALAARELLRKLSHGAAAGRAP